MVALDAMAQPQVGQGVGGRERVAGLLGDGESRRAVTSAVSRSPARPFEHRQEGQHPGLPGAEQTGRRQCLPDGGDRLVAVARADLGARENPECLGPPNRVGHHRQRRCGLLGCLVVAADGEQGPDQAGREPVPSLITAGRLIQFAPQQVGRQPRCLRGQHGSGTQEPDPGPALTRLSGRGKLLGDAQGIRIRGRELPRRLGVQCRAQRRRTPPYSAWRIS